MMGLNENGRFIKIEADRIRISDILGYYVTASGSLMIKLYGNKAMHEVAAGSVEKAEEVALWLDLTLGIVSVYEK